MMNQRTKFEEIDEKELKPLSNTDIDFIIGKLEKCSLFGDEDAKNMQVIYEKSVPRISFDTEQLVRAMRSPFLHGE